MRALDDMAEIEKSTIFGTSVHAVLRTGNVDPETLTARLRDRGLSVDSIDRVMPSLEDVFLDVVEHA
jgi:hypothetical protein